MATASIPTRCFTKSLRPGRYGLGYTQFAYSHLKITPNSAPADKQIMVSVDVTIVGPRDGEDVAQLYVSACHPSVPEPVRQLQGFRRTPLRGQMQHVDFTLTPYQLSLIDAHDQRVVEPGEFRIAVGGGQMHVKSLAGLSTSDAVEGVLRITGDVVHPQ